MPPDTLTPAELAALAAYKGAVRVIPQGVEGEAKPLTTLPAHWFRARAKAAKKNAVTLWVATKQGKRHQENRGHTMLGGPDITHGHGIDAVIRMNTTHGVAPEEWHDDE